MTAITEALLRRPAPLYERLLRDGPLQWSEPSRCWLVVGYDVARTVLRDERFSMPRPPAGSRWSENGFFASLLLAAEGPEHDRLRRLLGPVFAPRVVRARTARVESATHALLDKAAGAGSGVTEPGAAGSGTVFDGVAAISARLPVSVVGDLVGVPEAARDEVSALCRTISMGGGLAAGLPSADAADAAADALDRLGELVDRWLAEPEHLVADSALAVAAARPGALTRTEILANVFSLYLAGHDTSRNLLSALLLRLATTADLLDGLADGTVDPAAETDHALLSESPLTFTVREALADVPLSGQVVRRGDRLRLMLGAANHDVLTAGRSPGQLAGVTFGEGRHVCLGAHVARLEGAVLLGVAARRWSAVRLADRPQWTPHFVHRGLDRLPLDVTWRP